MGALTISAGQNRTYDEAEADSVFILSSVDRSIFTHKLRWQRSLDLHPTFPSKYINLGELSRIPSPFVPHHIRISPSLEFFSPVRVGNDILVQCLITVYSFIRSDDD